MIENSDQRARQALILWGVYIVLTILINGTIQFALGKDMHAWTASPLKDVLANLIVYGLIFLVAPLMLTKGWNTVRQTTFLLLLIVALLAMTLRTTLRPVAAIAVLILAWLHYRYDLSELGFRSRGWRGDVIAVLLTALLLSVQRFFRNESFSLHFVSAVYAGLDRWFFNPASTVENLFYFGFLTERLSSKFGRWWTPIIIGMMYGFHEMTNPEYWYEGVFFPIIFIGVALFAMIYLWRRNVIAIWLGDGMGRFLINLF
jgi:membrane protease YdiL (CAAX protease family)